MARRITKEYIEQYDKVELIQPLAHNKYIKQVYDKLSDRWELMYLSNSAHHICPYDGVFRNCVECGGLEEDFDISYCTDKMQVISSAALIERINDCLKAGLEVRFN